MILSPLWVSSASSVSWQMFHLVHCLLLLPRHHTPVSHLFCVAAWSVFLHDVCSSHRLWKDLISHSLFSPPSPPSFCLLSFFSLSSLCRGGALSDGWSAQTDPDPAWRDGEHVVMVVVVLLKSALLKPRHGSQTDCGPVVLESPHQSIYFNI